MARSRKHRVPSVVPATVILLARRLSTTQGIAPSSSSFAFLYAPASRHVSSKQQATCGRAWLQSRAACATKAKVPPVAYLANPDGGDMMASSTTEQSTEQAAWLGRIQYYGGRQMWRKAEDKFQQMQDEGVPPNVAICNGLMEAYLKAGRYVNAVGFLEDLCLGHIGNSVYRQGGDPKTAGELNEGFAAATHVVPNLRTFNLVLATLATGGKWKQAMEISAPMRRRGAGNGGRRGGGRRGESAAAAAVTRVAAEIEANAETYTHLIVACGKGGQPDKARDMFDYMRSYGIVPPPEATAALIRALARGGRGSGEALSLLADMKRAADTRGKGRRAARGEGDGQTAMMAVQSAGYSGAIEACAAAGEWQKAVTLLDEMRNAKIFPDSRCYGNAMRSCVPHGNWQLALALLNTMKKEGVKRTAFNYNVAMQACRKAKKNGKAIALLDEMEQDGVTPDVVTYNTCVTIAAQGGRLEQALELLSKASQQAGLELDVVSYRAALGGLRREKNWEAAVKLLGDMQRRGVGPDEISTAMAMNTCASAQEPLRALDLFRDMRDIDGVFPGLISVSALLEALADLGRWEDALRELRALSASGVKPNGRAVAYAMAACNTAKKWDQTLSLYSYADKMGIKTSMQGFILVARAYSSRGQWRQVLDVLARAEEADVAASAEGSGEAGERQAAEGPPAARYPPAELYEVAARALARAGMWEEAVGVVRKLETLPPVRKNQHHQAAGPSTYELILGAAATAGQNEAVLSQADAARAAIHNAKSFSASDNDSKVGDSGDTGELSPAALTHEVSAAGTLGRWDRVSPIMAKAMRSPSLRGIAGARLYAALISAATACGRPERGLEVFREMEAEAAAGARVEVLASKREDSAVREHVLGGVTWDGGGGEARRLPPPDGATLLAALDACAACGGEESVTLAIDVTKAAAAAAREPAGNGEKGAASRGTLSSRKLAAVLMRAAEVCAAAGADSTAKALAAKAFEIAGTLDSSAESDGGGVVQKGGAEGAVAGGNGALR